MQRLQCQDSGFLIFGRTFGIPTGLDWLSVGGVEFLLRSQKSGHEKVEKGPQLGGAVLNGGARQYKAVERPYLADRLRHLRLRIPNHVTLVQNTIVPLEFLKGKQLNYILFIRKPATVKNCI